MKAILILFLSGISFSANAQATFFEGKITYKYQYFDTLGNEISAESLGLDSEMHYFISEGNYKSFDENGALKQLYNTSTNKYFFSDQNQIKVMDASFQWPENAVVKRLDGSKSFVDKSCISLSIKSDSDYTIYYYSNELIVNQTLYSKHNFGNWNLFLNSSNGALALGYRMEYPEMIVTLEAIDLEIMDLSTADFDIDSYLDN